MKPQAIMMAWSYRTVMHACTLKTSDSPVVYFSSVASHDAFKAWCHMAGLLHTTAQIIKQEQALGSQALVQI